MIRRGFQVPKVAVTRADGIADGPITVTLGDERVELPVYRFPTVGKSEWRDALRENLQAITAQVRETGAEMVFLTYPADAPGSPIYGLANAIIRESARALHVRLIDLGDRIGRHCPKVPYPQIPCEYLVSDRHPSVAGHRRAAEIILETLAPG
jgi:hypothetical protein